jgi:hypothetical protein
MFQSFRAADVVCIDTPLGIEKIYEAREARTRRDHLFDLASGPIQDRLETPAVPSILDYYLSTQLTPVLIPLDHLINIKLAVDVEIKPPSLNSTQRSRWLKLEVLSRHWRIGQ